MTDYTTFSDIIDAFESPADMAEAMPYYEKLGRVYPSTIGMWKHRDSIPPQYWVSVVLASRSRKITGINERVLAVIAQSRKESING
jgi:hypothetical protein